jgi:DNA-binding LytR/AlgR family response regulator
MIYCIAVDDEPLALELISNYCSQVDFLDLKRSFTRTTEVVDYLSRYPVDLLFLDIQMPDMSGIDFYRKWGDSKMVIFTTAYYEYGVEGFNLDAVDYLLKPITFGRFLKAATKANDYFSYLNNRHDADNKSLVVRSDYRLVRIPFEDILYIEGLDDYIRIFTGQKRSVITRMSMKSVSERLPERMFAKVHRSYIINYSGDIRYSNRKIYIGQVTIPVGLNYEESVRKIFGGTK